MTRKFAVPLLLGTLLVLMAFATPVHAVSNTFSMIGPSGLEPYSITGFAYNVDGSTAYACSATGTLYLVNTGTGSVSMVAAIHGNAGDVSGCNGLAYNSDFSVMFALVEDAHGDWNLTTIETGGPGAGLITFSGPPIIFSGPPPVNLANDPQTDNLYTTEGFGPVTLIELNGDSGVATTIGTFAVGPYDSDGFNDTTGSGHRTALFWTGDGSSDVGMLQIDPTTAAVLGHVTGITTVCSGLFVPYASDFIGSTFYTYGQCGSDEDLATYSGSFPTANGPLPPPAPTPASFTVTLNLVGPESIATPTPTFTLIGCGVSPDTVGGDGASYAVSAGKNCQVQVAPPPSNGVFTWQILPQNTFVTCGTDSCPDYTFTYRQVIGGGAQQGSQGNNQGGTQTSATQSQNSGAPPAQFSPSDFFTSPPLLLMTVGVIGLVAVVVYAAKKH
jgi:hypothetical protein